LWVKSTKTQIEYNKSGYRSKADAFKPTCTAVCQSGRDVGAPPAADGTNELVFDIRDAQLIRPAISVIWHRDVVPAGVVAAIDQDLPHASRAHLAEGDLLRRNHLDHHPMKAAVAHFAKSTIDKTARQSLSPLVPYR